MAWGIFQKRNHTHLCLGGACDCRQLSWFNCCVHYSIHDINYQNIEQAQQNQAILAKQKILKSNSKIIENCLHWTNNYTYKKKITVLCKLNEQCCSTQANRWWQCCFCCTCESRSFRRRHVTDAICGFEMAGGRHGFD